MELSSKHTSSGLLGVSVYLIFGYDGTATAAAATATPATAAAGEGTAVSALGTDLTGFLSRYRR